MKKVIISLLLVCAPSIAFAQGSTAAGVAGGAVTGAVVGGPVGAVVGGVVGGAMGAAAEPPREVYTYVESERVPSVTYRERVAVGEALPTTVEIRRVPKHEQYGYVVLNDRRVIVDYNTRKVVKVIE